MAVKLTLGVELVKCAVHSHSKFKTASIMWLKQGKKVNRFKSHNHL